MNADRGSHFTSRQCTQVLPDCGVKISMDGKGRWRPLGHRGSQRVDSVGMSESMGMQVGDAGTFTQAFEDLEDPAGQQCLSMF